MRLASSFAVPAEHAQAFAHFLDHNTMRASIPRCTQLQRRDDLHYRGRLVNEIAHLRRRPLRVLTGSRKRR